MTVNITGIFTPPTPETRDIAYLLVEYNNTTYTWCRFIPSGVNVGEYITSIEQQIYNEIDYKEAEWANLSLKTKTIIDMDGNKIVVDIDKEEIVKPDNPDYYALRRSEYPLIGDQLDAQWTGVSSDAYIDMQNKAEKVKQKYPKPPYI